MNPMEFLRYLALRGGDSSSGASLEIAVEAAQALSYVADKAELVMACRRLLAAHPYAGRLWTLTAAMCTSVEPTDAAHRWIAAAGRDPTYDHVPDEDGMPTSALLVGPTDAIVADDRERGDGDPMLLVAPFGTAVPADVAVAAAEALCVRGASVGVVPLSDFDRIVGPAGVVGVSERGSDGVVAPELLVGLEADVHKSRQAGR